MKTIKHKISFHENDLPNNAIVNCNSIAIDTETTGINIFRDRLCLIQVAEKKNRCYLIKINKNFNHSVCNNLKEALYSTTILKIFHYARFDMVMLKKFLSTNINKIYCTKIASKIARTFTDKHGLRNICNDLLKIDLSKEMQSSYWGGGLIKEQKIYAVNDVLFLHKVKFLLDTILNLEERKELVEKCFNFITTCTELDLLNFEISNLF